MLRYQKCSVVRVVHGSDGPAGRVGSGHDFESIKQNEYILFINKLISYKKSRFYIL